jgi:hypothetical protein
LYLAFANKKPPSTGAGDAGIAANVGGDSGTSSTTDEDAGGLAPLTVDAGKDAGKIVFDAGFRPVLDAGKPAATTTSTTTCHWIPACQQAKTMRAIGQTKQADKLAADCRAAGCVPE